MIDLLIISVKIVCFPKLKKNLAMILILLMNYFITIYKIIEIIKLFYITVYNI